MLKKVIEVISPDCKTLSVILPRKFVDKYSGIEIWTDLVKLFEDAKISKNIVMKHLPAAEFLTALRKRGKEKGWNE